MTKKYEIGNQAFDVWTNQKGYPCITVNQNGKDRAFLLHKIIYEATNGPVPDGHEIHHVDGNKANWSPDNLKAMNKQAHRELHRQARSTREDNKAGSKPVKNPNQKHPENQP